MRHARRVAGLGMAAALACAGAVRAQPRGVAPPAYEVALQGSDPVTGLGATLPVQILDAGDRRPLADARISGARLVSPSGAVTPLASPPEAGAPGLRLFRADLPVPGAWALEFTVSAPGRRPATASLAFEVQAPGPRASAVDPLGPSVVATEAAGGGGGGPSIAAPGPAIAGATPAAPALAQRSPGYSPEAAPFCATCAAEAPH